MNEPMDMDALHFDLVKAGNEEGVPSSPEERGDIIPEEQPDTGEEEAGQVEGNPLEEGQSEEQGEAEPLDPQPEPTEAETGIPAARVGQISAERRYALEISDGLVNGTVDPEAIRAFGGAQAAAKALARRDVELEALGTAYQTAPPPMPDPPQPEEGESEVPKEVQEAFQEMQLAAEEFDEAGMAKAWTKLNGLQQSQMEKVAKQEAQRMFQEAMEQQQAQQDQMAAQQTAEEIRQRRGAWEAWEENQQVIFNSVAHGLAQQGMPMSQALAEAEKITFGTAQQIPQPEQQVQKPLSQRDHAAKIKAAQAAIAQPPPPTTGQGHGVKEKTLDPEKMTDEEFDRLPEQEKQRLRGDFMT